MSVLIKIIAQLKHIKICEKKLADGGILSGIEKYALLSEMNILILE